MSEEDYSNDENEDNEYDDEDNDSNDEDNEYNYDDDDKNNKHERNVDDRINKLQGDLGTDMIGSDPNSIFKKQVRATITNFFANNILTNYMGNNQINYFYEFTNTISPIIDKINYIENKNPYAFLLGYIMYRNITIKTIINDIQKDGLHFINAIGNVNIQFEDVLRYYRLIINLY